MWGSYYDIPKAIFYLLKGDCSANCFAQVEQSRGLGTGVRVWDLSSRISDSGRSVLGLRLGHMQGPEFCNEAL